MSQQAAYFLQIEAINLDANLFDTDQLSVIRGGSFLIAWATRQLHKLFPGKLRPISTGASVGLYRVLQPADAAALRQRVLNWLNGHPDYRLFTFAVALAESSDLPKARAELAARIRHAQLRQPALAPDLREDGRHRPCGLEGRRAAIQDRYRRTLAGRTVSVSTSVARRLDLGRRLKANLHLRVLGAAETIAAGRLAHIGGYGYAPDLKALADCPAMDRLDGKIAVIHLDGNRFGAIQQGLRDWAEQQAFDACIGQGRARFLVTLLEAFIEGEYRGVPLPHTHCSTADPKTPGLRLETLLWGGDELTLVVPAWLGFAVIQVLFDCMAGWAFGDLPLTHAGGLVFCHAHTPIARMRRLAQDLAEGVKERMPADHLIDAFDYLVLESIDYPVERTLEQVWTRRYGPVAAHRRALRPERDWFGAGQAAARRLLAPGGLGRGQVFRLARDLVAWRPPTGDADLFGAPPSAPGCGRAPWDPQAPADAAALTPCERRERRLLDLAGRVDADVAGDLPGPGPDLDLLAGALGIGTRAQLERAWLWLHLAELWDYLVPAASESSSPAAGVTP